MAISVRDGTGQRDRDFPRHRHRHPGRRNSDEIWARLYRGDKSRSQHGLGLGLSLVKAVVEAHRGRVTVVSQEGAGSEFRVYLPK